MCFANVNSFMAAANATAPVSVAWPKLQVVSGRVHLKMATRHLLDRVNSGWEGGRDGVAWGRVGGTMRRWDGEEDDDDRSSQGMEHVQWQQRLLNPNPLPGPGLPF